jgi:hypothetical protein
LELKDLRRVVTAVERLRGAVIEGVTARSDLRHLKVETAGGAILVIQAGQDEQGRPRLEVDVVEPSPAGPARQQMEVNFD